MNLANMHGVGQVTQRSYAAVGANVKQLVQTPVDPIRFEFAILPVDSNIPGNPVMPIVFGVKLHFNPDNGRPD